MYRQYLRDIRARGGGGGVGEGSRIARRAHSRRDTRSRRTQRNESPEENGHDNNGEPHKNREDDEILDASGDITTEHVLKKMSLGNKKRKEGSRDLIKKFSSNRCHRLHKLGPAKLTATQEVINGNVSVECPSTVRIVRIFTSSTFTDTRHERNALMERVYPALKEMCQQHGYEFQVVDMRWGIRDEATDDHRATELCLREVDLCKKLSTGPYFVTFLSHKYGYRDFPNKIEASEYETLVEDMDDDIKNLLNRWFKRDNNAVPPTYVLHSISTVLSDYRCDDKNKRKAAKASWHEQSARMQDAIVAAAKQKLDKAKAHRYLISVTEAEISRGILESDEIPFNCLWFHRVITDIDQQQQSYLLSRYKECTGDETKVKESQELLHDLRDEKLPKLLAPGHHLQYKITWTENGIDPENNKDHEQYINKLCIDFREEVTKVVQIAIEARKTSFLSNPLYAEVVEHTVFCRSKCQAFHGRHDTLDLVSKYLRGNSISPLVVHGPSGCGKTSIVAMAAYLALEVFNKSAGTVIRFIGTTPDSSTIGALLASVITQIWLIYGIEESELPADLKELTKTFHTALSLATEPIPLVLLLDSLDQLDPAGGARQLSWMPKQLPEHVKLVVSTLPETQYESFPALEGMYDTKNFEGVPTLDDEDVNGILDKWLDVSKRSLLADQRRIVVDAFKECPLPLFLKLSFDEACRWSSFTPLSEIILQTTIRGSINALFNRMEELHGHLLVSKSLAYLTLSKSGLTESELEDILSCDDDVLNDVYMYWTPPVRRLPPLLLVRLQADLGHYLVDRGADGVRVFYWYHRQFIEAATDKYCSDPDRTIQMNTTLANYFGGTWANGRTKPYCDRHGKQGSADRKVASQPNKFNTGYNLRKFNNLPHHRTEAKQLDLLKRECLLNFKFLQEKLHASGLRQILNDFLKARTMYPDDGDLKTVGECLQLSQDALIKFPKELPSQFLGRIRNKASLENLLEDCKNAEHPFFLPDKPILIPPGGQLVHCMADHKKDLTGLDMTSDSHYAVTCSYDESLKIWDIKRGTLVRSIDKFGDNPEKVVLCCNDNVILVQTSKFLHGYKLASGIRVFKLKFEDGRRCFCVAGVEKDIICTFSSDSKSAVMYSAKTGKVIEEVKCELRKGKEKFSNRRVCVGSHRYTACLDSDQHNVFILDVESKKFVHKKKIFSLHGGDFLFMEMVFLDMDGIEDTYSMVFSPSGDKLYIVAMFSNDLHVFNTDTMEKEKEIRGEMKVLVGKFHITTDGNILYFINTTDMCVLMWDLKTGQRSTLFHQPTSMKDVIIMDMTTAVTIGEDNVVRVFDLTRGADTEKETDKEEEEYQKLFLETEGATSGTPKQDVKWSIVINSMKTLANPRYVLLHLTYWSHDFVHIWDVGLDKIVKHIQLDVSLRCIAPLPDSTHILVDINRRIKKINLLKEEVMTFQGKTPNESFFSSKQMVVIKDNLLKEEVMKFQGKTPNESFFSSKQMVVIKDGEELATTSRGRLNVKIYNVSSGKVVDILKAGNKKRIDELRGTLKGSYLVAETEERLVYVFNVAARQFLYSITCEEVGLENYGLHINDALLTHDDAFFVWQGSKVPAQSNKKDDNTKDFIFCWDLKNKCLKELVDYEMYRKYADSDDNKADTGVYVFKLLDDRTVVSTHKDDYIRVFDLTTGEIVKRLHSHKWCTLNTVLDSPYFLSNGVSLDDNSFRLLHKKTWETVATFSPDFDLHQVNLTSDGHFVVGYSNDYSRPIIWRLMGKTPQEHSSSKPLDSFLNIYGEETVKTQLVLKSDQDALVDPDDPDTDQEEADDDSEAGTDVDPNKDDSSTSSLDSLGSLGSLKSFGSLDFKKEDDDMDKLIAERI